MSKTLKLKKSDLWFRSHGEAVVKFAEGDPESGTRSVHLVLNNGEPMPSYFFESIIVDLESLQVPDTGAVPVVWSHGEDLEDVLGMTTGIQRSPRLEADAALDLNQEKAAKVSSMHDAGFPFECSIYVPNGRFEEVPAGQTVEVNGRSYPGPLSVIRGATLRESTICLFGRDSNTGIAAGEDEEIEIEVYSTEPEREEIMDLATFKAEHAEIAEEFKAEVLASVDTPEVDHTEAVGAALAAERERVSAIFSEADELEVPEAAVSFVKDGTSLEDAKVKLRDARIEAQRHDAADTTGGGDDTPPAEGSFEDQCKATWDANPKLREEFTEYKFYESYKKYEKAGRIPARQSA
jgi:hypothetical protein